MCWACREENLHRRLCLLTGIMSRLLIRLHLNAVFWPCTRVFVSSNLRVFSFVVSGFGIVRKGFPVRLVRKDSATVCSSVCVVSILNLDLYPLEAYSHTWCQSRIQQMPSSVVFLSLDAGCLHLLQSFFHLLYRIFVSDSQLFNGFREILI